MATTTKKRNETNDEVRHHEVDKLLFKPLKVNIYRDGKVIKRVLLADPREAYCRHYNSLGWPSTARPAG